MRRKIFITIMVMLSVGLSGVAFIFLINTYINRYSEDYIFTDITDVPFADAIMVLGASVNQHGIPSNVLRERLDNALHLYESGKAKKIILSGDHGTKEYDEVNAMKDYLMEKGIPREDLFLDHAGFNTYDSMYRARDIFGVETLIISTQRFHINRSVYIARKMGIEAFGFPVDKWIEYYHKQYGKREMQAKVKAFFDITITKREPRFLGEPISIEGSGMQTEG